MVPAMIELNALAIGLLVTLILLWNLDLVAGLLSLKSGHQPLPAEFKDVWDDEKYEKAQAYELAQTKFGFLSSLFSLTILIVFWMIGGFGWLDEIVRTWSDSPTWRGLLYLGLLSIGSTVLSLPFDYYHTFVLEEKFGFNKSSIGTWISDQIKGLLITVIIGGPIIALLLYIFQNVENAWLWAWLVFTMISLGLTYLAPSLLLPLFNKFEPLADGSLKQKIHEMAAHCRFPLTEISVMDGSKRSAKSNAFFTGLGKRKKIALFDTLVESQSDEELVAVLAHEIGHFKKKHIVQRLVLSVIQTAVIFFLLGQVIEPSSAIGGQLYAGFGVQPSVYLGFILFFILFRPVSRVIAILMNVLSRKHEFEADAYASDAQDTSDHLVTALKKLSANNLSNLTPHPLEVFLHHSHPPVLTRIEALRAHQPQPLPTT